jgi:hypothetical protein
MANNTAQHAVPREDLSILRMAAGGEKRYSTVIDGTRVKEWVGIGWIDLREATTDDLRRFPRVSEKQEKK